MKRKGHSNEELHLQMEMDTKDRIAEIRRHNQVLEQKLEELDKRINYLRRIIRAAAPPPTKRFKDN
jgi:TATA-binding protein-associated factor Taf7